MHQSKLVQLLATFDTRALTEFESFLQSPFFNKNNALIRFYHRLKKYAPRFHPKKIEKQKIFHEAFPGEQFNDRQMNHLINLLLTFAC